MPLGNEMTASPHCRPTGSHATMARVPKIFELMGRSAAAAVEDASTRDESTHRLRFRNVMVDLGRTGGHSGTRETQASGGAPGRAVVGIRVRGAATFPRRAHPKNDVPQVTY